MYIKGIMQRYICILVAAFCITPLLFAQAGGNTRYVAVQTTALKDSTGFFARDLRVLSLGDTVTFLRESGKWTEVRAGNITGWVASSSLSTRQIVASASAVSVNEVALAGKGFSPETEMEYRKNGLNYSMVDSMEQITVPVDELSRFITEGRLARGE